MVPENRASDIRQERKNSRPNILGELLEDLERAYREVFFTINIRDIYLEEKYTIVDLDNDAQGIALNFDNEEEDRARKYDRTAAAAKLLSRAEEDRLLYKTLLTSTTPKTLYERSVYIAILSALSQPKDDYLVRNGIVFREDWIPLSEISTNGDTVAVIGFGGFLPLALRDEKVKKVYVADLNLKKSRQEMMDLLSEWGSPFKEKAVELTDGSQNREIIKDADIACITGSALCNDTMDDLLLYAQDCREIIVQRHSASLLPIAFFRRGATYVVQSYIRFDFLLRAKMFPLITGRLLVKGVKNPPDFYHFIDANLPTRTVSLANKRKR